MNEMFCTTSVFAESATLSDSIKESAFEYFDELEETIFYSKKFFEDIEKNGLPEPEVVNLFEKITNLSQSLVYSFIHKDDGIAYFGETGNGNQRLRQHMAQIETGKASSDFIEGLLAYDDDPNNWQAWVWRTPNKLAAQVLERMLINYIPTMFNSAEHGGI
jgi:hypothetical protein